MSGSAMATFKDLTPYTYSECDQPLLNIGWLGAGTEFQLGAVASGVVDALLLLAVDQRHITRGVHNCELCDEESPIRIDAPVPRGWVSLGMGELHVPGRSGQVYAAPSLVIHYIIEHGYCPPDDFQTGALDLAAKLKS